MHEIFFELGSSPEFGDTPSMLLDLSGGALPHRDVFLVI
jgi:hypothetical protein